MALGWRGHCQPSGTSMSQVSARHHIAHEWNESQLGGLMPWRRSRTLPSPARTLQSAVDQLRYSASLLRCVLAHNSITQLRCSVLSGSVSVYRPSTVCTHTMSTCMPPFVCWSCGAMPIAEEACSDPSPHVRAATLQFHPQNLQSFRYQSTHLVGMAAAKLTVTHPLDFDKSTRLVAAAKLALPQR